MATNSINYTCPGCGRTWKEVYQMVIEERNIHLSRIVSTGAPENDALCTCGRVADAELETPMVGCRRVRVRLFSLVHARRYSEAQRERHYEELVQALIEQEKPINIDQLEDIEARAAKIVEMGLKPAEWKALSAEQQADILKCQPAN